MATIKQALLLWFHVCRINDTDCLFNDSVSNIHLINQILLLFRLYIYKSQDKHRLNINELLANIIKFKELGKVTVSGNARK